MTTVNVKRGIEFKPELYAKSNHTEWLDAVGKELEAKGISLTVGDGANKKVVNDAATLQAAMKELTAAAKASGSKNLQAYLTDLTQAIDDVVKPDSEVAKGDQFDFSLGSPIAVNLGISDNTRTNYASTVTTPFGKASKTKPVATMVIDGVTFQTKKGAPQPPGPDIDLSKIPHLSAEKLKGTAPAYGRAGVEYEDTLTATKVSKNQAVEAAAGALTDTMRSKSAVGLSLGNSVPLDEMMWDSDGHAMRMNNPYVSYTLDSRSIEVNPNTGQPRVAIGRDFFWDGFMAKRDLTTGKLSKAMQNAHMMYRFRIRYGSDKDPIEGTRVLVGMKLDKIIGPDGTPQGKKVDSRADSGVTQAVLDSMESVAITGKQTWQSGQIAPATVEVFRTALGAGITDDIGGEHDVLTLEAAAYARQIRGRFHVNETSSQALKTAIAQAGQPKLDELTKLISEAADWPAQGDLPSKAQLLAQAQAITDKSAIVKAATDAVKKLDPSLNVDVALVTKYAPDQAVATVKDSRIQQAVAEATSNVLMDFSAKVDDLQRNIAGNTDRAVRDAGGAEDVRDFFKQKAAVASFMARADLNKATSGAVPGQPATYTAYAQKVIAMPDGKEKTDLLQSMGIGVRQLQAMTDASFASAVTVDKALVKKQTFDPFIAAFDAQLAGPNKDAFVKELGDYLAGKRAPALSQAADKAKVAGDLRKNLVAAHAEVLHRMLDDAGNWGRQLAFNNYRQVGANIQANTGNVLICSTDFAEFYDRAEGDKLTFAQRVSRAPLDASKMVDAAISNDVQIELGGEDRYVDLIEQRTYAINAAAAGALMDYALDAKVPGLKAGDSVAFEQWYLKQAALPQLQRDAFLADVTAFAKKKGSNIDFGKVLMPMADQVASVEVLSDFAKQKDPALNVADRTALEAWYRQKANLSGDALPEFLNEIAKWADKNDKAIGVDGALLKSLDFEPFAGVNAGKDYATHAKLIEDLEIAQDIWGKVLQAKKGVSDVRGKEIARVMKDNGADDVEMKQLSDSKGDHGIEVAAAAHPELWNPNNG
ncbi:MAG: hypothetical protein IPJ65_11430 [Archangiaceae bacterium]|nr:hypothetical protein [Archangiaceae bacterium]